MCGADAEVVHAAVHVASDRPAAQTLLEAGRVMVAHGWQQTPDPQGCFRNRVDGRWVSTVLDARDTYPGNGSVLDVTLTTVRGVCGPAARRRDALADSTPCE